MMPVEKVAGGFQFTEGPVWLPSRQELLFSDIPASRIYRWKNGRVEVWRESSHQANGNTLDRQGRILSCEHETRRVTRTEPDGTITVLADRFEGKRLNSPNDLKCKRDGTICFTDPPYGVKPEERELDFQGVFRLGEAAVPGGQSEPPSAVDSGRDTLTLLARDFVKPNGLCFSPDESILYIADTELGHVRAFDLAGNDRVFCKVERPDGMETDSAGNLYVAGMTGVEVFDPAGHRLGAIPVAERPSNLEFGDTDLGTLYITARTSLYRVRAK